MSRGPECRELLGRAGSDARCDTQGSRGCWRQAGPWSRLNWAWPAMWAGWAEWGLRGLIGMGERSRFDPLFCKGYWYNLKSRSPTQRAENMQGMALSKLAKAFIVSKGTVVLVHSGVSQNQNLRMGLSSEVT